MVKGVVKVISKMGISTIQSYCGAQIFEARRPEPEFHRKILHRNALAHRRGGDRGDLARSRACATPHAFPDRSVNGRTLEAGGQYQWREDGEHHLFNPETVYKLQQACRTNDYSPFQDYPSLINDQSTPPGHPARAAGVQIRRAAHPA